MSLDDARDVDKETHLHERWEGRLRAALRSLITDELIAEHEANPLGHHSDALQRVLQYFRRAPTRGKYVAVMTKPWNDYKIGVLPGASGQPVAILEDDTFATENAVLHAIFVRRVDSLMNR